MPLLNELITNDKPVIKHNTMEVVYLPQSQTLEYESFHHKILSKLCHNNNFKFLVNFNFFHLTHENFSVSGCLVKDIQGFV